MQTQRAYSVFSVKEMDDSRRVFRGIATTPAPDRMGDTVDPMGVSFKNPLPLLHQHDHRLPIGLVRFEKPTEKGVEFEAEIPVIQEPGALKDRVDTAWGEIKYGLVRAVSIGFRALKYSFRDDDGIDFHKTEVFELSSVTIPANAQALISAVKSLEGRPLPRDLIKQIKTLDYGARNTGPVQLIAPESVAKNLNGAVRLVRP